MYGNLSWFVVDDRSIEGLDPTQIIVLTLIGLTGGLLSGLIGVGGGVFFVPALVLGAGWQIRDAVVVSLIIIVFSSLSGTLRNARSDDPVDWKVAATLSLATAPASLIGVYISRVSPEMVVEVTFATLLLAVAYPTARRSRYTESRKDIPLPLVILAGVFVGALSGLVGVGGGVLMVPLMVLGLGVPTKQAISTSLAIVLFTGIIGAAGYIATGFNDPADFLKLPPLIIGSVVGAWVGVRLRDPLPSEVLRAGFGVFMVIVALRIYAGAFNIF